MMTGNGNCLGSGIGVGDDIELAVARRRLGTAYGWVFRNAAIASRMAWPVLTIPIAVGAPGGSTTMLTGGAAKSNRSANPSALTK
jgi:hypothetical protein